MANVKELRVRIKSVGGIAKITGAMEMVASMKLRAAQARALSVRPYSGEVIHLVEHLAEFIGSDPTMPLFRRRKVQTTGVLLITSDRGLCGAYNSNVLARFHDLEDEKRAEDPDRSFRIFCYGRKGYAYLYARGYPIDKLFAETPLDKADFAAAKKVSAYLLDAFTTGKVDEIVLLYTDFASVVRFVPTAAPFLPLGTLGSEKPSSQRIDYLLEPDPETIFDLLIPRYLDTVVANAMLSSIASEHASRRMAMKAASDAATRMAKDLKKVYNRARQEGITKELLDIIGGASAV